MAIFTSQEAWGGEMGGEGWIWSSGWDTRVCVCSEEGEKGCLGMDGPRWSGLPKNQVSGLEMGQWETACILIAKINNYVKLAKADSSGAYFIHLKSAWTSGFFTFA